MGDIFLSYSEKDRKTAAQIAALLESSGWSVWWDREIPAGKTWRDTIEDALQNMRCMVVLWSGNSIKSDWVREEADEGKSQHKLIPVLIEAVKPPVGFREIQAADLIRWDGSREFPGFRQLVGDLEARLGKTTRSSAQKADIAEPQASPQPSRAIQTVRDTQARERRTESFPSGGLATLWRPLVAVALLVIIGIVGFRIMRTGRNSLSTEPVSYPENKRPNARQIPASSAATVVDAPLKASREMPAYAEKPKLSAALEPEAGSPAHPKVIAGTRDLTTARINQRCNDLLMRAQVGEPMSSEDHAWFEKECK